MTKTIQEQTCQRCGHKWFPRQITAVGPIVCPKCRSPYWRTPAKDSEPRARAGE